MLVLKVKARDPRRGDSSRYFAAAFALSSSALTTSRWLLIFKRCSRIAIASAYLPWLIRSCARACIRAGLPPAAGAGVVCDDVPVLGLVCDGVACEDVLGLVWSDVLLGCVCVCVCVFVCAGAGVDFFVVFGFAAFWLVEAVGALPSPPPFDSAAIAAATISRTATNAATGIQRGRPRLAWRAGGGTERRGGAATGRSVRRTAGIGWVVTGDATGALGAGCVALNASSSARASCPALAGRSRGSRA